MATKPFIDYLSKELTHIEKINKATDLTEMPPIDFYKASILKSLQGNYDDLADFQNIQKALIRILELNQENIYQCIETFYNQ